jgi:uracil-DNA glycosylase family protein
LRPRIRGYTAGIAIQQHAVPETAAPFVPRSLSIKTLARAALECTGCPLFEDTTQTVFGKGPASASLILVGEQPGDVEDKRGLPFVGPAGAVLWQCIEAAGVDSDDVYATNAVKHFKHETRGKRRIHKRPDTAEVEACHPWLDAELRALKGPVIVALGAVAARSLLGRTMPVAASRGKKFDVDGRTTFVTYHPSAVLRADDRAAEVRAALVADLKAAWRVATSG